MGFFMGKIFETKCTQQRIQTCFNGTKFACDYRFMNTFFPFSSFGFAFLLLLHQFIH